MTDTTIPSDRGATPAATSTGPLFVRQATGLVKGWSALDASIYCFFAISFGAFGFYVFSLACFIPDGSLPWAVVLTTVFLVFEILVYAALMAVMPRAGGDYVWQTRVLGGGLGFVLAIAGWWFAMWQFVPIYGSLIVMEVVNPLLGAVGATSTAAWFASDDGILVSSIAVVAISSYWVAMGVGGYAKVQKWSLIIGGIGLLLFNGNGDFKTAFDREAAAQFGSGADAYARTLEVGGIDAVGLGFPSQTWLLIPLVLFWNMWVIWGAVLAGETRGARDMGRNVLSMGGALVAATVLAFVFFGLAAKTFGWDFYHSANSAYWGAAYGTLPDGVEAPLSTWPSPVMLAGWLVDSAAFQVVLILLNAFWLIGLLGTLFLSATRVIFAAAFDRVLPESVAKVTKKRRVPWVALLLLMIPGIVVSFLYAYWGDFATYVLNTALLLAVTFLGTAVAAILLPFRMKNLYRTSPLARFEYRGIPLTSVCGAAFAVFLLFNLYYWLTDDVYGVNNRDSMIYLGVLYALAIGIFAVSSFVRRRQGVRLTQVHREIPAD